MSPFLRCPGCGGTMPCAKHNENTRAPAGAILYEHEDGRYAVAASPGAATFTNGDPKWHRVGPVEVRGTSAPAGGSQTCGAPDECPFCEPHERCAPLPLTADWSKPAMAAADQAYKAPARECLAAAPVADERASFEAWWPTDPVARAHADNSRDLALIEHGWHGRAALSGGSPEPVSGSEV